jgi:hypothetical protein
MSKGSISKKVKRKNPTPEKGTRNTEEEEEEEQDEEEDEEWILRKMGWKVCTGFVWLRIETSGEFL